MKLDKENDTKQIIIDCSNDKILGYLTLRGMREDGGYLSDLELLALAIEGIMSHCRKLGEEAAEEMKRLGAPKTPCPPEGEKKDAE